MKPGDAVRFYDDDNKVHHGLCLAVLGDDILAEYRRPKRPFLFTAREREGRGDCEVVQKYTVSTLPRKWQILIQRRELHCQQPNQEG